MQLEIDNLVYHGRIRVKANINMIPETLCLFGAATGTYIGGKGNVIVTGRDYRRDSRMLKRAFSGGLLSVGIDVMDLHAAPAPVVQFAVRRFGAQAGILFSCGHYFSNDAHRQ